MYRNLTYQKIIIVSLLIFMCLLLYINKLYEDDLKTYIQRILQNNYTPRKYKNATNAHSTEDNRVIDLMDELDSISLEGNFFFHETSFISQPERIIEINQRQACSVESAARLHPDHTVYLIFTSPVRLPEKNELDVKYKVLRGLLKYKNIKIRSICLLKYMNNTPLHEFYLQGNLSRSNYVSVHTSDVLRLLSLWKFGGTYLDLDFVTLKNFDSLGGNFASYEDEDSINNAVLNFAHTGIGHRVAELCVNEIATNFNGESWVHNGPDAISRVMRKVCNVSNVIDMNAATCKGFQVLSPSLFYPIYWSDWPLLFDSDKIQEAWDKIKDAYAVHMWNSLSADTIVYLNRTEVLYGAIASKYCPNVYKASGDIF